MEVVVETTLLHKMFPRDGSIRDVHLDTSRDPDIDDANVLDVIFLLVVFLPIHLLMDDMDVAIVVHLVASLDVDVPLLLRP